MSGDHLQLEYRSHSDTDVEVWKLCDMSAELFIDFSAEEGLVRY